MEEEIIDEKYERLLKQISNISIEIKKLDSEISEFKDIEIPDYILNEDIEVINDCTSNVCELLYNLYKISIDAHTVYCEKNEIGVKQKRVINYKMLSVIAFVFLIIIIFLTISQY